MKPTRMLVPELLRQGASGIREWNRRVNANPFEHPVLTDGNFDGHMLQGVKLANGTLAGASFRGADLRGAFLGDASLVAVRLRGSNFSGAQFRWTSIASDLSEAVGLDEVVHQGPSHVSVDSILRFKEDLPERFLRGCGFRDEEIAYFRSVIGPALRFYTCFISYSSKDEEFASRLHDDFQAAGIRCWKWTHDARTGRSLWGEIDQAIRIYNKLVLVASEASLRSPAVIREIERALQQEDEHEKRRQRGEPVDPDVLFPLRLDDFLLQEWQHERKADVVRKVIADAREWKNERAYMAVRDRLIRDLTR